MVDGVNISMVVKCFTLMLIQQPVIMNQTRWLYEISNSLTEQGFNLIMMYIQEQLEHLLKIVFSSVLQTNNMCITLVVQLTHYESILLLNQQSLIQHSEQSQSLKLI